MTESEIRANEIADQLRNAGVYPLVLSLMAFATDLQRAFPEEDLGSGFEYQAEVEKLPGLLEKTIAKSFVEAPGVAKGPAKRVWELSELGIKPECVGIITTMSRPTHKIEVSDKGRRLCELKLAANRLDVFRFVGHQKATHVIRYAGEKDGNGSDAWMRLVRVDGGAA